MFSIGRPIRGGSPGMHVQYVASIDASVGPYMLCSSMPSRRSTVAGMSGVRGSPPQKPIRSEVHCGRSGSARRRRQKEVGNAMTVAA